MSEPTAAKHIPTRPSPNPRGELFLAEAFDGVAGGFVPITKPRARPLRDMVAHYTRFGGQGLLGAQNMAHALVYRTPALGTDAEVGAMLHALAPSLLSLSRVPPPVASTDAGLLAGASSLLMPLGVDLGASDEAYELALFFVEAVGHRWDGGTLEMAQVPVRLFAAREEPHYNTVVRRHLFFVDDVHHELVWLCGGLTRNIAPNRMQTAPTRSGIWRIER